jgi:hypothetical protein
MTRKASIPADTQNCGALIGALQLHIIVERPYKARQPHSLFNPAAVYLVLPDQEIGYSSRIIETTAHKPCRDNGHVLAVESRPETKEMLMPAASLFALLHRLIPVIVLSGKIPLRGCVFKESVKVCTPKSPPFSDDFAPDFAAFDVFPHCSGA